MPAKRFSAIAIALLTLGGSAAQAADAGCDRACLQGFVDQYTAALAAHNPASLPLNKGARYTENGQTLELGDGMWGPPVTLKPAYKLYFADPKAGQVGFYGTLEEHGHPAILGLRLKIENRKISEMEAIVIRSTARGSFSSVEDMRLYPTFTEALAPSEKRSRDELNHDSKLLFRRIGKSDR